jgi:hypothetical protein
MFKRSHFYPKPCGKGRIESFAVDLPRQWTTARQSSENFLKEVRTSCQTVKMVKSSKKAKSVHTRHQNDLVNLIFFVVQADFHAESTRTCDVCKIDVKLSFGGEANWNSHLESHAHHENESKTTKSQSLMTWFQKSTVKSKVAASSTPMLLNDLPSSSSLAIAVGSKSLADSIRVSDDEVHVVDPELALVHQSPPSALFQSLRNCIDTLPTTVEIASKTDLLAHFSGDPVLEIEEGSDPWENLDPALNIVVSYGASVREIAGIIRRGDYGMDGMYRWLKKCVAVLKVDEALLEMKVQCLIDAMILLCMF